MTACWIFLWWVGIRFFPEFENNYGRAYAISTGSPGGPDWLMFRRDSVRSASIDLEVSTDLNKELVLDENFIEVHPNPTDGLVNLVNSGQGGIKNISLYNARGQLLLFDENPESRVDLSEFSVGVYWLRVETTEGVEIERVVVE